MKRLFVTLSAVIFLALGFLTIAVQAEEVQLPKTCIPANKMDQAWWKARHEANCARIEQGNVDLLLIGDSITHGWDGAGAEIQKFFYEDRNYVNMGFGGDQTQHVLWRLNNAPMDKIHPKAAVLLIGINNLWGEWPNASECVAQGIKAIVDKLQALYPDMKILVLDIFMAQNPDHVCRKQAKGTNDLLPGIFKDYKNVEIMDINDLWLSADGTIPRELMKDLVHPTREGYILWGNRVDPTIAKMLGVAPKEFKETH